MELRSKTGAGKSGSLEKFYSLAWATILDHYKNVTQIDEDAMADERDESTRALLWIPQTEQRVEGRSGDNLHAENDAYNQVWEGFMKQAEKLAQSDSSWEGKEKHAAQQLFDTALRGKARIKCIAYNDEGQQVDTHKESCFMCSAIAHTLGISVEKKDTRGYSSYALPEIFKHSPKHLKMLVGESAFAEYEKLSGANQASALLGLGGALYEAHKGSAKSFKLS